MSNPSCRRCRKPILPGGNGLRASRRYHAWCQPTKRRDPRLPHDRRPKARCNDRGRYVGFENAAKEARARDKNTCIACGEPGPQRRGWPVHHIIPELVVAEWARQNGNEPHALVCLITLSPHCHGRCRMADDCAKRADFLGWAREIKRFCGSNVELLERFVAAARYYKLPLEKLGLSNFA